MSISSTIITSENGRTLSQVVLTYDGNARRENDAHTVYEVRCETCGDSIAQVDSIRGAADALDDDHECAL